jgi:hypothetical protein
VHFPATKDNGNLHTAEYIKFLAAFFNLEKAADEIFRTALAAYTGAAAEVAEKPVVAWISYSSWDGGYVLSYATYKTQLTEAAGGRNVDPEAVAAQLSAMTVKDAADGNSQAGKNYVLPTVDNDGNKSLAAQAFFAALSEVDVLIDETWVAKPADYTFDTFLSTFYLEKTSSLKFIQSKMVLRYDGTLSSADGWDWYESRVAYPDWAVEGLARELHGDASKRQKYFRNVAKGVLPEVITAAMCTKELPSCKPSLVASDLLMLTETATTTMTAEEQAASGACGPWQATATAVAAAATVLMG